MRTVEEVVALYAQRQADDSEWRGRAEEVRRPLEAKYFRRFWERVEKTPTCWLWKRGKIPSGYGMFWDGSRQRLVHRLSYELLVGPIPDGLQIDHLCRVRSCVNPAHLEPVAGSTNNDRSRSPSSLNAKKTHCNHGHEFTVQNTYWKQGRNRMERACKTCKRVSLQAWRERQRAVS